MASWRLLLPPLLLDRVVALLLRFCCRACTADQAAPAAASPCRTCTQRSSGGRDRVGGDGSGCLGYVHIAERHHMLLRFSVTPLPLARYIWSPWQHHHAFSPCCDSATNFSIHTSCASLSPVHNSTPSACATIPPCLPNHTTHPPIIPVVRLPA